MDELNGIVERALAEFTACADPAALENAKAKYLGKSGALTEQLKALGKLAPSERAATGARINAAKSSLEEALTARRVALADAKLATQLAAEALDVSLPGRGRGIGGLHPLTRTLERCETLFRSLGFAVADGPEIEDDFHNFEALNFPFDHPARDLEAGEPGHLHVEEHQIRLELAGQAQRLDAVGRLADDLDVRFVR